MAHDLARQPLAVKQFFDSCMEARVDVRSGPRALKRLTADAAAEVVRSASLPAVVGELLKRFDEKSHGLILDSVLTGMDRFKREHGFEAPADFVEFVIHDAVASCMPLKDLLEGNPVKGFRLDSATNYHHDQLSLNPATPMVAIMAQFAEPIPFAAYLPADVKSNEARLAIMSNKAQSNYGDYLNGDSLDGIAGGGAYLDSERICVMSVNGGGGTAITYTVTAKQSMAVGGVAVAADNPAVPLLRGRTVILVNGIPAARESEAGAYGTGNNTLAGAIVIGSTSYAIAGTANSDTGVISITSTPALPAGNVVEALAYVDYEKAPQLTPKIGTDVQIYKLYARPSRGLVQSTIDAMTQMQAELALDPRGQAMLSLRAQFNQELHYGALKKMLRIAANLTDSWNYDYTSQIAQKDRSQIWLNLFPILAGLSQRMANQTIDHGISTLYVTGELAAQARGLPSTIWEPSGIVDRPGIYRLGRLNQQYEVYYTPKLLAETNNGQTSQILCIGRGSNTARNPIVRGEAVPPVFLPLGLQADLVQGDGFYTRQTTEINPHEPSARSAALINVTNIK